MINFEDLGLTSNNVFDHILDQGTLIIYPNMRFFGKRMCHVSLVRGNEQNADFFTAHLENMPAFRFRKKIIIELE